MDRWGAFDLVLDYFVAAVALHLVIGDVVRVKVVNVDDSGRIKLSRKAVLMEEASTEEPATV